MRRWLVYRTDEKQFWYSVRSWEQVSDCIHALCNPWCKIARELPSSRAREEHCFLPEWFLLVVYLAVRSRRSPSCPAKPESFLWATHLAHLLKDWCAYNAVLLGIWRRLGGWSVLNNSVCVCPTWALLTGAIFIICMLVPIKKKGYLNTFSNTFLRFHRQRNAFLWICTSKEMPCEN